MDKLKEIDSIHKIVKRYYTKELEKNKELNVYDLFNWKKIDVFLKDHKTNKVLVDMKDLEFLIATHRMPVTS